MKIKSLFGVILGLIFSSNLIAQSITKIPANTLNDLQISSDGQSTLVWVENKSSGNPEAYFCTVGNCANSKSPIGIVGKNYITSIAKSHQSTGLYITAGNRTNNTNMTVDLFFAEEATNYLPRQRTGTGSNWNARETVDYNPYRPLLISTMYTTTWPYNGLFYTVFYAESASSSLVQSCGSQGVRGLVCTDSASFRGTPVSLISDPSGQVWATNRGVFKCSGNACNPNTSTSILSSSAPSSARPKGNINGEIVLDATGNRVYGMSQIFPQPNTPNVFVWSCPTSGCGDSVTNVYDQMYASAGGIAKYGQTLFFSSNANPRSPQDGQGLYKCTLSSEFTCTTDSVTRISSDVIGGKVLVVGDYLVWLGWNDINIMNLKD